MQYLDDPERLGIHPDQEGVNKAFDYALMEGRQNIILFFTAPERTIRPNQLSFPLAQL